MNHTKLSQVVCGCEAVYTPDEYMTMVRFIEIDIGIFFSCEKVEFFPNLGTFWSLTGEYNYILFLFIQVIIKQLHTLHTEVKDGVSDANDNIGMFIDEQEISQKICLVEKVKEKLVTACADLTEIQIINEGISSWIDVRKHSFENEENIEKDLVKVNISLFLEP